MPLNHYSITYKKKVLVRIFFSSSIDLVFKRLTNSCSSSSLVSVFSSINDQKKAKARRKLIDKHNVRIDLRLLCNNLLMMKTQKEKQRFSTIHRDSCLSIVARTHTEFVKSSMNDM